jgi:hypothetical protein
MMQGLANLKNLYLHILHVLYNLNKINKRIKWETDHLAALGEFDKSYKMFVEKSEGKKHLGDHRLFGSTKAGPGVVACWDVN